jgi:agmatinase
MIEKPFQGIRTFCKVNDKKGLANHMYAIVGMGVDSGTSYRPGTRLAPAAIRDASLMLTDGVNETFPVDITQYVIDLGDTAITNSNTSKMLEQVESTITNVLAWNKHPVILGGEHTITLGILRALYTKYSELALVHFDAHCDTWSTHFDEPIGHGTWLYNAIKEKLVDPNKVISIGVRSPADKNSRKFLIDNGGVSITARQAMSGRWGKPENIKQIKSEGYDIPSMIAHRVGNTPCYLSFDIDCLDPAYAPGTGTPEIGGLTTMWVLDCIERLKMLNWIGMDCVEVSPPYDHSDITSLAAATICWTYLSMIIHKLHFGKLPLTNEQVNVKPI